MEPENVRLLLQSINLIGTFGVGCWLYIEKRNDKTNDRINELSSRVEDMDKKVTELKAGSENAPKHSDLTRIYDAINGLAAQVNQLIGKGDSWSAFQQLLLNRITEKGLP